MQRIVILVLAVLGIVVAGCGSSATGRPGVTEDPTLGACRAGVTAANQNRHDVGALDVALGACGSLAMLEQALRDDPGYLDANTDARTFATNRCASAGALSNARICLELAAAVPPSSKPKVTKKPASVGSGSYYRPPGWNGKADVDCKDFDTYSHAQSFFKGTGGSKTKDPYHLDSDHDGLACEGLR